MGIDYSAPQLYPEYAPDYYAIFFRDPDGVQLEVAKPMPRRALIPPRLLPGAVFFHRDGPCQRACAASRGRSVFVSGGELSRGAPVRPPSRPSASARS